MQTQCRAVSDPQITSTDWNWKSTLGCYRPRPPSPFIIVTQPESLYSFYRPVEAESTYSTVAHDKAVYHSVCRTNTLSVHSTTETFSVNWTCVENVDEHQPTVQ